jgi:hypothetical protein
MSTGANRMAIKEALAHHKEKAQSMLGTNFKLFTDDIQAWTS